MRGSSTSVEEQDWRHRLTWPVQIKVKLQVVITSIQKTSLHLDVNVHFMSPTAFNHYSSHKISCDG